MATLPSRRDSNRTCSQLQLVHARREMNKTEEEFVAQFLPGYKKSARAAYQQARSEQESR
jgi:hypothetical protein